MALKALNLRPRCTGKNVLLLGLRNNVPHGPTTTERESNPECTSHEC